MAERGAAPTGTERAEPTADESRDERNDIQATAGISGRARRYIARVHQH